jgi:BlaI family penicillinase repressor
MGGRQLPDLSKAEWELMNHIWRCRRASVADIRAALLDQHGWTHNTVKTMAQRLVKKGYLRCDDSHRAHIYEPSVRRRDVVTRALSESLDRMLDDRLGPLVAYAAERRGLSDEEVATLRRLIEKGEDDDD